MSRRIRLGLLLAGSLPLAACWPKTGDPDATPRVVTLGGTPTPARAVDPVESKRIAKLHRISLLEASRPLAPDGFAPWLADADPSVRAAAVTGLGRAAEALAGAGGDVSPFVAMLLSSAKDERAEVRGAAAAAIGLVGPPASGTLDAPLAAETNAENRSRWVRAAGRVAPLPPKPAQEAADAKDAAPPAPTPAPAAAPSPEITLLGKALADPLLAPSAAWALGVYGLRCERGGTVAALPTQVVDALRKGFRESAGESREPFAYAMWRLREPGTSAELRAGLSDPSALVRGWCARGLAALPGMHARREITRLLRDSSSDVRVEASRAVTKLEDKDAAAAIELVDLLERSDPPRLVENPLAVEDVHSAVAAAEALGELGFRATAEPLRSRLASDSPYLFGAAAIAYAKVAGTASIFDLSEIAGEYPKDSQWRFRRSIAEALAFVKPAPEPGDPPPAPGVPEPARALLDSLLADRDPRVSVAALDSYAALAGAGAAPRLLAVLGSSNDVAMIGTAADRLSALDPVPPEAGGALVAALSRLLATDPETASLLVAPAAKLGGEAALPVLETAAVSRSNGLMLAAAKALRARGKTPPVRTAAPAGLPDEAVYLEAADWTRMTVHTKRGEIRLELFPETAPITVWQIGTLARQGYFRSGSFHRVVPAFVAQGGDPRGDGWGGPTATSGAAASIPCELSDLPYVEGTLGMALSGRDTGGSQFFLALTPQPHLEGNYTVFGRVIRGEKAVEQLQVGDEILDITVP